MAATMLLFLAFVYSLLSLVFSLPVVPSVTRDVWAPLIIIPNGNTTWIAGDTYIVTWNTSTKPSEITNPIGLVYLRHGVNATEESVLVQGFPLTAGTVNVTIPADTQPDNNWIIILMGDSGDWSPLFTIVAPPS